MNKSYRKSLFKGSLPIFILAGVVLFIALVLDIVQLTVFSESDTYVVKSKLPKHRVPSRSENIFENLHKQYPTYEQALSKLKVYNVKFKSHNFVIGNSKSAVKVYIFNDNDCVICRKEQVRLLRELKKYEDDILIVLKHMPKVKGKESLSAMFGQIAIREGVYIKFLESLVQYKDTLETPEDYFILLDKVGVNLDELRLIMTTSMTDILTEVQDDLDMAKGASAYSARSQPVVYINGYRLGADYLPEHNLELYIDRLLSGESIIPGEGLEEDEEAL